MLASLREGKETLPQPDWTDWGCWLCCLTSTKQNNKSLTWLFSCKSMKTDTLKHKLHKNMFITCCGVEFVVVTGCFLHCFMPTPKKYNCIILLRALLKHIFPRQIYGSQAYSPHEFISKGAIIHTGVWQLYLTGEFPLNQIQYLLYDTAEKEEHYKNRSSFCKINLFFKKSLSVVLMFLNVILMISEQPHNSSQNVPWPWSQNVPQPFYYCLFTIDICST